MRATRDTPGLERLTGTTISSVLAARKTASATCELWSKMDTPRFRRRREYILAWELIRSHEGAKRIREWYEGILESRGFRDYAGRRI